MYKAIIKITILNRIFSISKTFLFLGLHSIIIYVKGNRATIPYNVKLLFIFSLI